MRYFFTLCIFIPAILKAQFFIQPIDKPGSENSRVHEIQIDTVLALPFWDDFAVSNNAPDPYKWAYGPDVFVNETYGVNSPTYRVATLDGLNNLGRAHGPNNSFPGPADSLVTHAIDLSQLSAFDKNTVYLSFYWQAFGNGELPDEEDSLVVQFYTVDSAWVNVWEINGGIDNSYEEFRQEIIQVSGDQFFHKNFKMKFISIINQGGPFDTWNLDYIYLNKSRDIVDTLHFDRSLSGSASFLFSPYYEVPAQQFFANPEKFLTSQNIQASNLDNSPHPLDYFYRLENLTTQNTYLDVSLGNDGGGAMLPLEKRELQGPVFPTIPINTLDSQVFQSTFYYSTGDKLLFEEVLNNNLDTVFFNVDLKVNDTIRHQYLLHNYYAYDDGVAEYASGINVDDGRLVAMFTVEEQDTLTHIDFHFPDINPNNPSGKAINVIVMNELSELGEIRSQPYSIQLANEPNAFTRIKLNTPVIVQDTVYIGYQQTTDFLIGVGFDRNNPAASDFVYYNVLGEWLQNDELQGALMIRPVFQDGSDFILSAPKPTKELLIYPNPTKGTLYLPRFQEAFLFNLSGQQLAHYNYLPEIDLSSFDNGVYLLKMIIGGRSITQKVIIKH